MKVAYVTMTFPAPSEAFASTDVRTLRDWGVDVSVYAIRAPHPNADDLLEQRRLTSLPLSQGDFGADMRGLMSCLRRPLLTVRLVSWLLRVCWKRPVQLVVSLAIVPRAMGILAELRRQQPDVVHLFWGHYPCLVGYLVRRRLPDTVLSLFLGAYDLTRRFGGTSWVARRADLVTTHARCNVPAIELLGVSRQNIHFAHRGIDLTLFRPAAAVERRIVTAGRLDPGKGMDDVLCAFREIHDRWPDATLRVLGQGRERANLERLARSLGIDRLVTFLGHVPQGIVAAELAAAEVFLLMSWDETERLPNVVKEAMACGCVCVVTDTLGMTELVEDRRHGFLVQKRNVKQAVLRVNDVFSKRIDTGAMLQAAADHIASCFDASESMRSYVRHWQALSRRRSTRYSKAECHDALADITLQRRRFLR